MAGRKRQSGGKLVDGYLLLHPEHRVVSRDWILSQARDSEANHEIDGGFGDDVTEAIRQLEDAGFITLGNRGKPVGQTW